MLQSEAGHALRKRQLSSALSLDELYLREGSKSSRREAYRWDDNIKMVLKEMDMVVWTQ
jgi:hypothetical protein